ncbi:MAG TPA: clostripain-related cysteine peptidase [Anaerolineales bacterium]|nr:clostripain-related cysteine peptidase [Anaerolineales bacterium]
MRKSTKSLNRISFLLVWFTLIIGQSCAAPAALTAQDKWTVMVYMVGDNELEEYVIPDIEDELASTGSSQDVNVLVLADRAPGYDISQGDWQTTKLFYVTQGMTADSANAVADWGERNMGDAQTLIEFIAWSKANYPADHYALYFWDHGWSWHPGWVLIDETDGDTLDYDELKNAIPSLGFIDVVGYDGCNMASLEMLQVWRGYSTALTSSQEYVEDYGIEYDVLLAELLANPNMNANDVAIATSQSAIYDKTWSALATDARLDTLLAAVDDWSIALLNGLPENRAEYQRAFEATQSFWDAPMDKDLYDMAYELERNVADREIKTKSQAVMDAVRQVVLFEKRAEEYSGANGITIYHISTASEKDPDYLYYRSMIDLAIQTSWDEFLDSYAR